MKTIRVLVLEDDLETLGVITGCLKVIEDKLINSDQKSDIALTIFSEYTQVEDYLNKLESPTFDLVLLDRDCKLGGSFHALDLDRFNIDKVIGISSVPEYNEYLKNKGVKVTVDKNYKQLEIFRQRLIKTLSDLFQIQY